MLKAVFFDLDDTLYDTTGQVNLARKNAVKAMVSAGLAADEAQALEALEQVVEERGPNYPRHFNELFNVLGLEEDAKIIAAGVVAYHETKRTYLVPYPDTVSTLLGLRDRNYLIGVVTDGLPVKQWEKLIRLGLGNFFHTVVVSEDADEQKPSPKPFLKAAGELDVSPGESVVVGDRVDRDMIGGKLAGMLTVQLVGGQHSSIQPKRGEEEPDYIVSSLTDILRIVDGLRY